MAVAKLSTDIRQAMAVAFIAVLDADTNPAYLEFYAGANPQNPATAITDQTLLGTLVCDDPCATATGGVIAFGAITQDDAADADGTATWARLYDGSGAAKGDFDVTNEAGTGAIKLNTTTIAEGGPILLSSFTITMPGAAG